MRRLAVALALVTLGWVAPARADWEVKRSPFDVRLVARYKQQLHANPDDASSLARLTALYRQYKTLDALEKELQAAAEKSNAVNDWLVLAHFFDSRHQGQRAMQVLEKLHDDSRVSAELADHLVAAGDLKLARQRYEEALVDVTPARRQAILRKLVAILNQDSSHEVLADLRRYNRQLLEANPNDVEARRQFAEALATHGEPREAAAEWRIVAQGLGRDPQRQVQAWLRVGDLSVAADEDSEARALYDKAWSLAPRGNYLRREAADKIVSLARKHDGLRPLAVEWEKAWPARGRDFNEWDVLARLHDELGDADQAQEDFRHALEKDPHAIDARKRLIALYERTGRDAEVISEYRRLIAAAPGEPRFRMELAERLWKSGASGHAEAQSLAAALGRETSDPAVHVQLAELYNRWGLNDLALAEQELLVKLEPDDESHLTALGELYWQRGNKKRALDLWHRLLDAHGLKKEQAMARLADVYAEHDLAPEALDLYQKATRIAPDDPTLKKGLASALERLHRDRDAEEVWMQLFDDAAKAKQRPAQIEARQRLITLLSRQGRLGLRAGEYRTRAEAEKDEAVASAYALFAADALVKMGRVDAAESELKHLVERSKDAGVRADALVGLAQVQRARHNLREAVAALKQAAELMPNRARELYPQISELSLQLYQDADALSYAKRAIQLGPADAAAQVRLGEVLEKSDDLDGAAAAYERALEIDDRLWKVYFTLARLRIRKGDHARAAELYRTLIRRSPDEEQVVDAARRAIDLEEYLGTLAELERELSPLAYAHADRPMYRNLLLELYDRYGTPLVQRARAGDETARPELLRLGEHGVRPLLDVLVDGDAAQQRTAVMLLGELGNPSAAPPLFKIALTRKSEDKPGREDLSATMELREQAALAAAQLATARDLPSLLKLASDPEKQLRLAAMYGLGRIGEGHGQAQSLAALVAALDDGAAEVQAMACLSLGQRHEARALEAVLAHLGGDERSALMRVGCAFAVGAAGLREPPLPPGERQKARVALAATLDAGGDDVQRAAAWSLGVLGPGDAAPSLVKALFVKRDEVRRAALLALSGTGLHHWPPLERNSDGPDVRHTLTQLGEWAMSATAPPPDAVAATKDHQPALVAAVTDALGRHRDVVLRTVSDLDRATPSLLTAAWNDLRVPLLQAQARGDETVRARIARLGARHGDVELCAAAFADRALPVRLAAFAALAEAAPLPAAARPAVAAAVERALKSPDWRERRDGALAARAHGELWPDRGARLLATLQKDPSGFVREATR
jgi:tetratricopeptide (TPR) repeat protein